MKRFMILAIAGLMACAAYTADAAVTNYKVVTGKTTADLATNVATQIGNGYQPIGPAFTGQSGFLSQTMVLGTPVTIASYETTEISIPVPTTGGTVTITPDAYLYNVAIEPAGTLAALTVNITAGTRNGQQVRVFFKQIITTLTNGANLAADAKALATSAAVGDSLLYVWSTSFSKWERMQ
jgi:hypothetical protein